MGVLWKLEPATAAKNRLYQRYLDAWWPILLQTSQRTGYSRPRVTLLDAFAGPGRYQDGEPGSPVFILERLLNDSAVDRMHLSPRRVHLIFIEKDHARHQHLLGELHTRFGPLRDLPVRIEVQRGDAGTDSVSLLTRLTLLGAWGPYRYSTNHQVVIDADPRLVVVVGRPLAGNRNDFKAWEESSAKAAVGKTLTIADGGYPGTGLVIPHRRQRGQTELPDWQEEHNKSHKQVRARVEHVFARMKTWKILRDCRLKGDGVHHAMLGIARMHNVAITG